MNKVERFWSKWGLVCGTTMLVAWGVLIGVVGMQGILNTLMRWLALP